MRRGFNLKRTIWTRVIVPPDRGRHSTPALRYTSAFLRSATAVRAFERRRNPCSREKDRSPGISLIAVGNCCHCLLLLSLTFQLNPPPLHSRWSVRRTHVYGLLHLESLFSLRTKCMLRNARRTCFRYCWNKKN